MKLLLAMCLGTVLLGGCEKDQENAAPQPAAPTKTKTELLTAKTWVITGSVFVAGATSQDVYSALPACQKDDITKFNTDKSVRFDEGADRCSTSKTQFTMGTWELTDNETKLSFKYNDFPNFPATVVDIVELKETVIRISKAGQMNNTTGATITTYKAM